MADEGATLIRDIVGGGSANRGEFAYFDLDLGEEGRVRYAAPFGLMFKLVSCLHEFSLLAERERAPTPDGQIAGDHARVVTEVAHSARSPDGRFIALDLKTTAGFPLLLAMTPDVARDVIARLQKELGDLS